MDLVYVEPVSYTHLMISPGTTLYSPQEPHFRSSYSRYIFGLSNPGLTTIQLSLIHICLKVEHSLFQNFFVSVL